MKSARRSVYTNGMSTITVLIMPLKDGFRAAVGGSSVDSYTLRGFGREIEEALYRNRGDDIDIVFALSNDLKPHFAACSRCGGRERVEIPGTVAGQTMKNEFSEIDFSKLATQTCPECKGLGAQIPGFWDESRPS